MYHLRVPETAEQMDAYYQFRWEILRKPLHQPLGSERDAYDALAHHQTVVDEQGRLMAIGRLSIMPITKPLFALWRCILAFGANGWARWWR